MTRIAPLVKGLAALAVLAALVVGVPWALWHFVGWPLPHHLPSAAQVGLALSRQGIPAQTLIDALAVVVWLTWATLVASLAVEIPAALSGRHPPHLPIAGPLQPVAGRLVAAVIVACLALAPRPAHASPPGGPAGRGGLTARGAVAALVVRDATLVAETSPSSPTLTTAATHPASNPPGVLTPTRPTTAATTYVVQRGDTLWGIAERELGDPLRWSERLSQRDEPAGEVANPAFGPGTFAHTALSNKIILEVAMLAGVDLRTTRRDIPWSSVVFAALLSAGFGYWTAVLNESGFRWYSLFPGVFAGLMFISILGMLGRKVEAAPTAAENSDTMNAQTAPDATQDDAAAP